MREQSDTQKGYWIECPTCDGSGSNLKSIRGTLMNTLCHTCSGEGGHYFQYKTLRRIKHQDKDVLMELMYGRN